MHVVRLPKAAERPWMVHLYDEHHKLICVCGPYNSEERHACVALFAGGWTLSEPDHLHVISADQAQRAVMRSTAERSRLIAAAIAAARRPGPFHPKVLGYPLSGRKRFKRALLEREARRWS
jgi:hypothetical protein